MAKAAALKKPIGPEIEVFPETEIEQGSAEWLEIRLGIPTASNFSLIMAEGKDGDASKTRREYMYKLAGELLTGAPAEGKIKTAAMQRGNEMEPEARLLYERTNLVTVERIGFVRRKLPHGRWVGCSPDGMTNKRRKGLEIKTLAPHLMIALLERGAAMPPEHRAQVHGTMWVANIPECDLLLYYRGMPVAPKFKVQRDEGYIKEISDAVEIFDHELHKLVKKMQAMGGVR